MPQVVDSPQPEAQVKIDPDLFGKFMEPISIWNYSSISRESYIAPFNLKINKLIHNYYSDMKSRGSGNFDIFFFCNHYAATI